MTVKAGARMTIVNGKEIRATRTKTVTVLVTEDEFELIERARRKSGYTRSRYLYIFVLKPHLDALRKRLIKSEG